MSSTLRPLLLLSILVVHAASSEEVLKKQLQDILDKHSAFWNASFSLGVSNQTFEVAVVSGLDNYADPGSKLSPDSQIPMGSTTKLFTSVAVLRLAAAGNLSLDDKVAPLIDEYLASPMPCQEAPKLCESECVPWAPCYTNPEELRCKLESKEHKATCSYCLRYLHCFNGSKVPSAVTLKQIWDNDAQIEQVTFRQLLGMSSGIKDYYFDQTGWLYKQVMGSTRDVEPLEYLVHMDHGFLFAPGSTTQIPEGKPGAGQTVLQGAYSTNGFSLVGLALAGKFKLRSWRELDQRLLAWGDRLPADDGSVFPTSGTCLTHPKICHQYANDGYGEFYDISNHSCLNSWLGGNIAPRPIDVARFLHATFATDDLIDADSKKLMTTLHPMTQGFDTYGLAYGLGLEAQWSDQGASPTNICGYQAYGHGGLDYGSGAPVNMYYPAIGLGMSMAMTSGMYEGSTTSGMACDRNLKQLPRAFQFALVDVMNAITAYLGLPASPCGPSPSYEIPPASDCTDAPSFGKLDGHSMTCAAFVNATDLSAHTSTEQLCDGFLSKVTLAGLVPIFARGVQPVTYEPPPGYNPNTTLAVELCKNTCLTVGSGPCWLRGPHQPWCTTSIHAAKPMQMFRITPNHASDIRNSLYGSNAVHSGHR